MQTASNPVSDINYYRKEIIFITNKNDKMIQRIQTLWLFLVVICGIVLLTGDIMSFRGESGLSFTYGFRGLAEHTGEAGRSLETSPFLQIVLIINVLTAVVAIFLFGRRFWQKSLAIISAVVSLSLQVLIIYIGYRTIIDYDVEISGWIKAGLPLVMAAASLMAWRGIDRDEKLVKSYDRLR